MVVLGLTEIEADVAPLLHRYEIPPLAVRVAVSPAQMVSLLTIAIGFWLTVTTTSSESVHPLDVVTVTV